jgi:tetratricopeptide (TPR) repeat protein
MYHEGLALLPTSVPHTRFIFLHNLAFSLSTLYKRNRDIGTLDEAMSLHREALSLHPPMSPQRSVSLNYVGNALLALYECDGDIDTLNEALSLHREALALFAPVRGHRFHFLADLARALVTLFEQNGIVEVLDEAISAIREALAHCPVKHRYRACFVRSMVSLLEKRRGATGDDRDRREIEDLKAEFVAL